MTGDITYSLIVIVQILIVELYLLLFYNRLYLYRSADFKVARLRATRDIFLLSHYVHGQKLSI